MLGQGCFWALIDIRLGEGGGKIIVEGRLDLKLQIAHSPSDKFVIFKIQLTLDNNKI